MSASVNWPDGEQPEVPYKVNETHWVEEQDGSVVQLGCGTTIRYDHRLTTQIRMVTCGRCCLNKTFKRKQLMGEFD